MTEPTSRVRCEIFPRSCPNPATLVVYGEEPCTVRPCLFYEDVCQGHRVCEEHGAKLRVEQHRQWPLSGDSPPFVVARIHTLSEASADV